MLVVAQGQVIDFRMEFLESITGLLDTQLDKFDQRVTAVPDPDMFGIYDGAEEVYGIGFVMCQRYLPAVYGALAIGKTRALAAGRQLASGCTVAQAVNHAANYWKHRDEWKEGDLAGKATRDAIEKLGVQVNRDYVASCVMAVLTPAPHRFKDLLAELIAWRDHLRQIR